MRAARFRQGLSGGRGRESKMAIKLMSLFLVFLLFFSFEVALFAEDSGQTGEELFNQNCSPCHPDGGNIFNKQKTLFRKDREKSGIKTAEDIVKKMRNPGAFDFHPDKWSGMKVFDRQKLSDADARKIADYILKIFN
jgi:mono/diheme cytochrome c family protein